MIIALLNYDIPPVTKYWLQYRKYSLEYYNEPFDEKLFVDNHMERTGKKPDLGQISSAKKMSQSIKDTIYAMDIALAASHLGRIARLRHKYSEAILYFEHAITFATSDSTIQSEYKKLLHEAKTNT